MKTTELKDAIDCTRHARADRDTVLLQLLEAMVGRIVQLEARVDQLEGGTDGEGDRDESDFERRVIEAVEERSGSIYSAIEAEIENKLEDWSSSYAFQCAVEEAIAGEAEEIVRKGLRSIL
jgi:hypothetical protein